MKRTDQFRRNSRRAILLSCAVLPLLCAPANAQNTSPPGREATDQGPQAGIRDEIVVTARRREELLQDVPVAITAFSGDQLTERGIQGLVDLQQTVPNLNMGTSTTTGGRKSVSVALRGVRSSAVTIYFSELVQSPLAVSDLLYDLESVQVLKGPQGTLFGANSTAGAILFQPARPKATFEAFVEGGIGNYDRRSLTGMVNLPLADGLALRVAGDYEKRDGFLRGQDRSYDADDHFSVRGSLKAEFGPFTNNLVVSHYDYDAQGSANVPIGIAPCPNPPPARSGLVDCLFRPPVTTIFGVPTAQEAYGPEIANGVRRTNLTGDFPRQLRNTLVSNVSELDFGQPFGETLGDVTFKSILGYIDGHSYELADTDGTILPVVTRDLESDSKRKSIELQLLGSQDWLQWVIGFYGAWDRSTSADKTSALPLFRPPSGTNITRNRERNIAFFGQATAEVFDGFHVTAGYRTTKTKISLYRQTVNGACTLPAGAPGVDLTTCTRTGSLTERSPSWTFGADYKFSPDGLIYFTTRRGFNQGGFNALAVTIETLTFEPEKLDDYELGLKQDFRFGDVFARMNLAVFRSKYKNIQRRNTPTVIVNGQPQLTTVTINAAKATIEGFEAELTLAPTKSLTFNLGASYIDPKYDEFIYVEQRGSFDLSKNRLAQAPKWSFVASVDYQMPMIAGFGRPSLNLNYSHQSSFVTSDFNDADPALNNLDDPLSFEPGHGIMNARASLSDLFESGIRLSVWANNLFKKDYFLARTNAASIGFASGLPGEPRTYGVTLRKDF